LVRFAAQALKGRGSVLSVFPIHNGNVTSPPYTTKCATHIERRHEERA
jgi:hypothetical protein